MCDEKKENCEDETNECCKMCHQRGYIEFLENHIAHLNGVIDYTNMQIGMMEDHDEDKELSEDDEQYLHFIYNVKEWLCDMRDMERESLDENKKELQKLTEQENPAIPISESN